MADWGPEKFRQVLEEEYLGYALADGPAPADPVYKAASGLRRFANTINELDEFAQAQALDEIADKLVVTGQAEGLLVYLDELSRLITARLSRR